MDQMELFGEAPIPAPIAFVPTHRYVADKAAKAYGSVYVGQVCMRSGPWIRGKALMRFADGRVVACLVGNGRMVKFSEGVGA